MHKNYIYFFFGAAFLVTAFFTVRFFTAAFLAAGFLAATFFGAAFFTAGFFTAAFLAAGFAFAFAIFFLNNLLVNECTEKIFNFLNKTKYFYFFNPLNSLSILIKREVQVSL
jgi:hypothetical protein